MADQDPVQKCKKCGRKVTADKIPRSDGPPRWAAMWSFRCQCGNAWEEVAEPETP